MSVILSPSLLSADFGNLATDIDMINRSSCQWLHLDVMDGVFVPNISFGFPVIKAVSKMCNKLLDAHFMIVHPERYIERTAELGVKMMTVHIEACDDIKAVIDAIHATGMKAGVAINPDTELDTVRDVLCLADMFLVMSVHPGFSGQKFIESSIDKVAKMRAMLNEAGSQAIIQVDGGVNGNNAPLLVGAGADVLVCGNYVFKATDPLAVIDSIVNGE